MGSFASKVEVKGEIVGKEIIEGKIIEENIYDPKNPYDDTESKYVWLSLHTNDKNFVFAQNQGFCIVSNEELNVSCRVWMRKKRTKPIENII